MNAVVRDGSRKLKALTEAVARKKEDEQLRAELERCKETQAKEKEQALAGMRKTVAAREASLHSEYGEKVGALQAEVKHVEAKFLEASRHFAQAAQRLQDGAARTSGEREAEAREREEALDRLRKQHREELERLEKDRELDRERAKRSAEELLAAAKQKHDDDVQKLQDVNDALRAEGDRKAEEAAKDATAKAEAARDVALGQLRAELEGTREEALAKQAAAHGGELIAERERLEARVAELTDDLEGLRGDSVRVAAELRGSVDALERELGETKQALRKTSDDLDGARAAARTAAKDALDKLDAATSRLEAALEDARAKGATVDARDEEIAKLKADHAKRVADDDEKHAAATASLTTTLTAKHDALEAKTTGERLDLEERLRSEIARGAADLDAARREAEEAEQNLVAAMEDREQAAARHHASEMDRAAEDAAAELGDARREAENRHANLLEAFEADRLRQETALRDLQGQYALLERKYAARESRPEDLEKIADLESENNQRAEDLARMKKEMAYFKNELLNREENFNKKFGASPNVGVMNVLPQKKKKAIPRGF